MNNKKKMSADCKDVWNAFMVKGEWYRYSALPDDCP